MSGPTPGRVTAAEARRRKETADGGFEIGVLIDAERQGSPLLLGLEWIAPGTEPVSWRAAANAHEVYYVLAGRVKVSWKGGAEGSQVLAPGESFYFPPALTYTAENVGRDAVEVVWCLHPSPPTFESAA